jgi:multiple sugar transport system ATP-binding protein
VQDLVLDDVTKTWPGSDPAVDHLHLTVPAGHLVGLVGPSGCGKSTVLRILAGFEQPTHGRVLLGTRDITRLEPRERHFGLVTQDNQLLRRLTAARNISMPLELRRDVTVAEIDRRLQREAGQLGIEHLLDQPASRLSAGQSRLVQLARAVIGAPVALLMDEPLAFLEDQVRLRLRAEIVRLHHERGLTSLLVTASQHDAMAMCDRIAVLFEGRLEQYATPADVYARPATIEVARFFGEPPMNIVTGRVDASTGDRRIRILGRWVRVRTPEIDPYHGRDLVVGVHPEDLVAGAPQNESVEVTVMTTESIGYQSAVTAATADGVLVDCVTRGRAPRPGTVLDLQVPGDRLHFFDPATGLAVFHPPG